MTGRARAASGCELAADELSARFAWRLAIAASQLPATCRHVLLTLSLHMNDDGGSCYPSYETLSSETGLHRATVIRQLELAEAGGWITRQRTRGRQSHSYQASQPSQKTTVAENDRRTECAEPSFSVTQPSPSARQPSHCATRVRHEYVTEDVSDSVSAFDEFWTLYPRKVKRPRAVKAWTTASKHATADDIIGGLQRWVQHWKDDGTEDRYIPHPATFLNDSQWEDPTPAPRRTSSTRQDRNDEAAARVAALFTNSRLEELSA